MEHNTDTNIQNFFTVFIGHRPVLEQQIAKLNKRAVKCGTPVITIDFMVPRTETRTRGGKDIVVTLVDFVVSGPAPKIAGWTFVATIEHTTEGNSIRRGPALREHNLDKYRQADSVCQHCNVNRTRKDTYVLVHDDGREMQVGRTCLRDFLGHTSPEALASWMEQWGAFCDSVPGTDDPDQDYCGGGGSFYPSLYRIVSLSCRAIAVDGFVPARFERGSTVGTVSKLYYPGKDRVETEAKYPWDDAFQKEAEDAINWAAEMEVPTGKDYLWNLQVLARLGVVTPKQMGLACSLYSAYKRQATWEQERAEREAARQAEAPKPVSEYQGTIAVRATFRLQIKKVVVLESQYGTQRLLIMEDEAGNAFRSFYSGKDTRFFEATADFVCVKGTVCKHDEYKGTKQTTLTRVVWEAPKATEPTLFD